MSGRSIRTLSISLAIAALGAAATAQGAFGATFTVNEDGDGSDANISDEACDANGGTGGDQCTLRAAIQEANDESGADIIGFNLPSESDETISPATALPAMSEQVTVDGYTQPGASPNTSAKENDAVLVVELEGSALGPTGTGLNVAASNSIVRGLVINRFGFGVTLATSTTGGSVTGNFLGTDRTGTVDLGNGNGVFINGSSNTIGGFLPAERNVVSGNGSGVTVQGVDNTIIGNFIGTQAGGSGDLGNTVGITFSANGDNNTIGGETKASQNKIAYSDGDGIRLLQGPTAAATGNTIARNSIYKSFDLGIDLGNDGVTLNDGAGDPDGGPNLSQNYPELDSAVTAAGVTTVEGELASTAGRQFTLRFFTKGGDEGKTYIGSQLVAIGGAGVASFTFVADREVAAGGRITATATDETTGDTSEFSARKRVVAG